MKYWRHSLTKTFSITEDRLLSLLKSEDILLSLECAGVDNWEGCDYAYDERDGELQEARSIPDTWTLSGVTSD